MGTQTRCVESFTYSFPKQVSIDVHAEGDDVKATAIKSSEIQETGERAGVDVEKWGT